MFACFLSILGKDSEIDRKLSFHNLSHCRFLLALILHGSLSDKRASLNEIKRENGKNVDEYDDLNAGEMTHKMNGTSRWFYLSYHLWLSLPSDWTLDYMKLVAISTKTNKDIAIALSSRNERIKIIK